MTRGGEHETRQVGVVAHHVGDWLPLMSERVRRMATGEELPPLTPADIGAINAKHAAANPRPDQAATVALIRDYGGLAAEVVAGLTDESLDRETPAGLTPERIVRLVIIGHVTGHEASIRATVGR